MSEHDKAKWWREKMTLSIPELSRQTGYSTESIYLFEKGYRYDERGATKDGKPRTKPINKNAWRRYRMACAGVTAHLRGRPFTW